MYIEGAVPPANMLGKADKVKLTVKDCPFGIIPGFLWGLTLVENCPPPDAFVVSDPPE